MKPNIVLIISDALRPKDLSLYGRKLKLDPNLQEIASESIVFNQNFSASNASDSSVTSLFSGKYPSTSGFIHQHPYMKKEELEKLKKIKFWLPKYLKNKGYDTYSATPLHLWFKKGFDQYTDKDQLKSGRFLDTPFIKRILLMLPNSLYTLGKKMVKKRASPEFYSSTKVIDHTISKISNSNSPFFFFMHLVDTHHPYAIAKIKKAGGKNTLKHILKNNSNPKQKEYIKKRFSDISATSLEQIEKKRDDSIYAVDRNIGRLYKFLKKKNILNNTIFIVLSDHGDNFGEHSNYFCRGGLFDTSMHVPLIIHLPGVKPKKINELTLSIDIAPTILDLLGEEKQKIDGKSLLPMIENDKKLRESVLLSDGFCEKRFAIRTKTKKLIITEKGKCNICGAEHHEEMKEEYDLEKDADELNNIYSGKSELENQITVF